MVSSYARIEELKRALGRVEPTSEIAWNRLMFAEQQAIITELEDQLRAKNRLRREDARRASMATETATKPDWGSW